jgi:hypothetical protein
MLVQAEAVPYKTMDGELSLPLAVHSNFHLSLFLAFIMLQL